MNWREKKNIDYVRAEPNTELNIQVQTDLMHFVVVLNKFHSITDIEHMLNRKFVWEHAIIIKLIKSENLTRLLYTKMGQWKLHILYVKNDRVI